MLRKLVRLPSLSLLVALFVGLGALAPAAALAGPGGNGKAGAREVIREKIRALRIARIIEALDLDEAGAARVAPVLDRAYDEIAAVTRDSGEARRELRVLVLAQPADEARINHLVDRLLANKTKIDALENAMLVQVRKVLTAVQVARLVVVLPEINHQIQQQIRRALRPGGPGTPPGANEDPF
jgi:Spy/CpxP family protein refolding chaperone